MSILWFFSLKYRSRITVYLVLEFEVALYIGAHRVLKFEVFLKIMGITIIGGTFYQAPKMFLVFQYGLFQLVLFYFGIVEFLLEILQPLEKIRGSRFKNVGVQQPLDEDHFIINELQVRFPILQFFVQFPYFTQLDHNHSFKKSKAPMNVWFGRFL